jgi:hypothetical protein
MDMQILINIGFGAAGAFGMWIINRMTASVDKIEERLNEFPSRYVAKDDYKTDISDIKMMLGKIFDRLDQKADK